MSKPASLSGDGIWRNIHTNKHVAISHTEVVSGVTVVVLHDGYRWSEDQFRQHHVFEEDSRVARVQAKKLIP